MKIDWNKIDWIKILTFIVDIIKLVYIRKWIVRNWNKIKGG